MTECRTFSINILYFVDFFHKTEPKKIARRVINNNKAPRTLVAYGVVIIRYF